MNWLTANFPWLGGIGLLIAIGSFLRPGISIVWPNWYALACGLIFMLLASIGGFRLLQGTPGGVDTRPEPDGPKPKPIVATTLERLKAEWDSEARADWPVAETMALLSELAYLPPVDADQAFKKLGFTSFMPIVSGSMIGYVVKADQVAIVIFRGTDPSEVSDWFVNLNAASYETPHGPIHKGFSDAYESLKPQIQKILGPEPVKHLWITGHSLGGALAVVCAYDLMENENRDVYGLMTFGQPMVTGQQAAKHIDERLLGKYARFANRDDIVTKVPPALKPCGSLVWFTDQGLVRSPLKRQLFSATGDDTNSAKGSETKIGEIQPLSEAEFRRIQAEMRAKNATKSRLPDGTPMFGAASTYIDDHDMGEYLAKTRKLLGITAGEP